MADYPVRINGKVVGSVRNFEYVTSRDSSHFMRKFKGYGISDSILQKLEDDGVDKIRIRTPDNDLLGTVEQFRSRGLTYTYNGDFQYFLPVLEMRVELRHGQSTLR